MKTRPIVLVLVVMFAFGSGCAKSDWIDRTLVTVDVTGVWIGSITRGGSYGPSEVRLELEQQGSQVTGYFRALPPYPPWGLVNGPIEGTVAGDAFAFRQKDGVLVGETTVDGDEMRITLTGSHRIQAILRRTDSSAPQRSQ